MPRVLVVTDRRFWRRSIGSEQRIAALVRFLARRGLSVVVAYVGRIPAKELARGETFRNANQHRLADLLFELFPDQIDLQVVEWAELPRRAIVSEATERAAFEPNRASA